MLGHGILVATTSEAFTPSWIHSSCGVQVKEGVVMGGDPGGGEGEVDKTPDL